MKKWLALLLAILMVASLAACTKKGEQKEDEPTDVPVEEPVVEKNPFQTVDELVYTVQNDAKLYKESNFTTESLVLPKAATELHRIQISVEDGASVVEYKAQYYYIKSALLTTADLYGKAYKKLEAPKTMYAKTNGMKVLSCADDSLAEVKATLSKNDEVQVVAEGNGWCKISYAKGSLVGDFFVKSTDLSAEQEVDYSKTDFSAYFTSANVKRTVLQDVNLRIAPILATATLANGRSLKKGEAVTIVGYGKGIYASWGKVLYADPVEEGKTPEYKTYYVKLCSEQCNEAYIEVPAAALKNQIKELGFKEETATLYVICDKLNIRYTPGLVDLQPDGSTNFYKVTATKGQALKMIAYGDVMDTDGQPITWAMIELDGVYLYVSKGKDYVSTSMTTVNGAMTLEQLLNKYTSLAAVVSTEITAKGKVTCYYDLDRTESGVELAKDDKVTLVATGTKDYVYWYVFQKDDAFYCAGANLFEDVAVTPLPVETPDPDAPPAT